MAKEADVFQPVSGVAGASAAVNGNHRCVAVQLSAKDLCLYNPVKKGLVEKGQVKYLLSPNHYHHLALREHAESAPKAALCASDGALPRLREVAGLKFSALGGLKRKLPANMQLIETQGLKTGEVWLRIESKNDVCWLVGDAFTGPKIKNATRFSAAPQLLKPFPNFGVGNRDVYVDWVNQQIEKDQPTTVIPCHGAMLRSKQLPKKLLAVVKQGL